MKHAHYLFAATPDVGIVLTHPGPKAICTVVSLVPRGVQRVIHALWHGIDPSSIQSMNVTQYQEAGTTVVEVHDRPFMIACTSQLLRGGFSQHLKGYRPVFRDPHLKMTYYARPWPLWAALRLRDTTRIYFWDTISWFEVRDWIRFTTEEGDDGHFYNIRPGKRWKFWRAL